MMVSQYSESDRDRARLTLESVLETINQLILWNNHINSIEQYYSSQNGMQLLAANCTLITAIGEGINRVNRTIPEFLASTFPDIPWRAIIGMRNRIAHGYFELDAEIVLSAIQSDIPILATTIQEAISMI